MIDDDSVNYKRVPIVSRWTDRSLKLEKTYKIEGNRSKKSQKKWIKSPYDSSQIISHAISNRLFPQNQVKILPNNIDFTPAIKKSNQRS